MTKIFNFIIIGKASPTDSSSEENKNEYDALFPPATVNSSFNENRTLYTRKMYAFFNQKVFRSQVFVFLFFLSCKL